MEKNNNEENAYVKSVVNKSYEFGFTTDVHTEIIPVGLNEDVVRLISAKKGEPEWMLEFRLKAFRYWKEQTEPRWGHVHVPETDYQAISYYADPTARPVPGASAAGIDPELEKTFDKLGIPLEERLALSGNTAVDAIMDSVSVKTTFKEKLREKGVIFCSIGEAIKEHPDLVRQYLGTVVPYRDNYFAALNSAVFSDGSFVYIPKGVRCPMELSSYFRINARNTGQFERTLIVADDDSYVSYLEGCTAPMRDENQLHAFVISELKEFELCIQEVTRFLPFVDNWATCDQLSPKVFRKHKKELIPVIKAWLQSGQTYTVRFAVGVLMQHALDDTFDAEYLDWVAKIRSEEYYVNMMAAWYFATALAKQYDAALPYIRENRLAPWTHNKAIQKAVESRRLTEAQKAELKKYRLHTKSCQ